MKQYDCAIQLPNWVGDTVMCTPLLLAIKTLNLQCVLLGKPWAHSLLEGFAIDTVSYPKKFHERVRLWRQIDTKYALVLPNSLSSAFTARVAGKKVLGMKTDGRRWLLQHPVDKHSDLHEVEHYWQLAKKIAEVFKQEIPDTPPSRLSIPLQPTAHANAQSIINQYQLKKFIIVCPFAAGYHKGQSKVWPHWGSLIKQLKQDGWQVVCCPAPNELDRCKELYTECCIVANVELDTFAALCEFSGAVISNDTGPMHIAASVAPEKTCGIFGVTDPTLTSPWGSNYLSAENSTWPNVTDVLEWVQQRL